MGKYRRAGRPRAKPAGEAVPPDLHGHPGRAGDFRSRGGFGNTTQGVVRQQRRKFRAAQEQRLSIQIVPAAIYPYPASSGPPCDAAGDISKRTRREPTRTLNVAAMTSLPGISDLVHPDMFHSIPFLGALGVVEAIRGAHQIPRDAPDALESHAFTDNGDAVPLSQRQALIHIHHAVLLLARPPGSARQS